MLSFKVRFFYKSDFEGWKTLTEIELKFGMWSDAKSLVTKLFQDNHFINHTDFGIPTATIFFLI